MDLCAQCGTSVPEEEAREFQGRVLCEDCYLDVVNPPKACDPWAVHTARSFGTSGYKNLTEHQSRILVLLKEHGPMSASDLMSRVLLSELEFHSAFATLRHMELARGFKQDGEVHYALFSS